MLDFLDMKSDCTGCTACVAACPVDCIKMVVDEEGFLYPESDSRCISCGKCQRVCPSRNQRVMDKGFVQKAFACKTKEKEVWLQSSSGGAFTEICTAWNEGKVFIAGAAWDGLEVMHTCVQGLDNIGKLCKSKYIASNMGRTFLDMKEYLESGKRVVFCGTPCQVIGLKNFLGIDYENLLTIDLICHGVGSPTVFKECIKAIEKKFHCSVSRYEFRAKRNTYTQNHIQRLITKSHKTFLIENDYYMQLFLNQLCLRPCCGENCKYRNQNRTGDFTIGDFKKLGKVFPKLCGEKGNYSTIIVNNEKADKLLPILRKRLVMYECDLNYIKKYNPLFYTTTKPNDKRDLFFREFLQDGENAVARWTVEFGKSRRSLKKILWEHLPILLRKYIIRRFHLGGGVVAVGTKSNISLIEVKFAASRKRGRIITGARMYEESNVHIWHQTGGD